MSILIVEDNLVALRIIETALQKQGFNTVSARTGKQALEQLVIMDNVELVITDILMPEIDGLNLIKLMRQKDETRDIPVIVSTSVADLETVKKAASLGVKHYIVKPIEKQQLVKKVQEAISKKPVQKINNNAPVSQVGADADLPDISILDLDEEKVQSEPDIQPEEKSTIPADSGNILTVQSVLNLLASAASLGSNKLIKILHELISKEDNLDKKYVDELQEKINTELKEKLNNDL